MKYLYESPVSGAFQAGKPVHFGPWVPAQGPTDRRNVIEGLLLRVTANIDVGTATLQGENLARLWKNILIRDIAGERWNLSGEASRAFLATMLLGPQRFHEHADISADTDIDIEHAMYIPFAKPWVHRSHDFSLPADVFRDLTLTFPTQADLDLGSSATTINSMTFQVIAITREEDSVEFKMRDVVSESSMDSTTEAKLLVPGAYLAEVLAYASGDALASMANWDDHTISRNIQPESRSETDWLELYRLFRQVGDNDGGTVGGEVYNDLIANDKARVVWMTPDTLGDVKLSDMPFVDGQVRIKATNTVDDVNLIARTIEPKSEKLASRVAKLYGVNTASLRAKTAHKTRREPSAWGRKLQFLTTSAVAA